MSDTDSFIDEVTEEVRRDRLFLMLKRYGWIGGLAVVAIVGGAAWNEYSNSKAETAAQKLGDGIIASLAPDTPAERADLLANVDAQTAGGRAVVRMMEAAALANSDDRAGAVALLQEIASDGELELIYRHIAGFKALGLQADSLSVQDRRLQYEALAQPGQPLDLLATEQLAILDIEEGNADEAIAKLRSITDSAIAAADLKERASQLIVALGGTLDLGVINEG